MAEDSFNSYVKSFFHGIGENLHEMGAHAKYTLKEFGHSITTGEFPETSIIYNAMRGRFVPGSVADRMFKTKAENEAQQLKDIEAYKAEKAKQDK
jgi:hypothetical protein